MIWSVSNFYEDKSDYGTSCKSKNCGSAGKWNAGFSFIRKRLSKLLKLAGGQ